MTDDSKLIPCPICRSPSPWMGNPWRPFCSERCKLIDLGQWAEGRYAVPGSVEVTPDPTDEH